MSRPMDKKIITILRKKKKKKKCKFFLLYWPYVYVSELVKLVTKNWGGSVDELVGEN